MSVLRIDDNAELLDILHYLLSGDRDAGVPPTGDEATMPQVDDRVDEVSEHKQLAQALA